MRIAWKGGVTAAAAWLCLVALPRPAVAQDVPEFIEVGKTYLFGVYGMMEQDAGAEVLEIGPGPWVRVRIREMDHPVWLNMNVVTAVVEMTPEFERYMEEEQRATMNRAYEVAMKSDLRNLVMAEEAYFADNLTYVDRADLSRDYFETSMNVTIETIEVNATGWSAVARHASSDSECFIYIGDVAPPVEDMVEGSPVCR